MARSVDLPVKLVLSAVDKASGKLREINAKLRTATKPISALQQQLRSFGRLSGLSAVGSGIRKLGSEVFALGRRFATLGALAGGGLAFLTKRISDQAEEIKKQAAAIGFSTQELEQWRFVAEAAGISQEDLGNALKKFTMNIGGVRADAGPLHSFLKSINPSGGLINSVKGAKTNAEAFRLMVDAMRKVEDPAKRALLATQLFGRGAIGMGNLANMSAEQVDALVAKFELLDGSLSEEEKKLSGEFKTAWQEFSAVMGAIAEDIGFALMGPLKDGLVALQALLVENKGAIKEFAAALGGLIRDALPVVISAIKAIAGWFMQTDQSTGKTSVTMWKLYAVLGAIALIMGGGVIAAIAGLVAAIGTVGGAVLAVVAAFAAAAVAIYAYWQPIQDFFVGLWETISGVVDGIWEKIKSVAGFVAKFSAIGGTFDIVKNLFGGGSDEKGFAQATPATPSPLSNIGAIGSTNRSEVAVSFANMPKGTRVQSSSNADLFSTEMGFAMGTP